jgi:hypothetical protein
MDFSISHKAPPVQTRRVKIVRPVVSGPFERASSRLQELPLGDAGTPSLCEEAEGLGFFFAGIGPYFFADGDALRMQRLAGDLDTSVLEIENAFARDLLRYIEEERQRVSG